MKKTEPEWKVLDKEIRKGALKKKSSLLVPVHISVDEALGFNALQASKDNPAGQYVDDKTGLREYSRLSKIIRIPQMKDLFIATADMYRSGEQLPPDIEELKHGPIPGEEEGLPPIPSDTDPTVLEIAATGEHGDDVLVMMPQDVVDFMDILQGSEHKDPEFGLQEFFKFKNLIRSVVRTVATVAGGVGGFLLGGPLGAGAGAYAGNAAGRAVTGGHKNAVTKALPNALYGLGAGAGASLLGANPAAMAGKLGLGSALPSWASGAATAAAPAASSLGGKAAENAAKKAPANALAQKMAVEEAAAADPGFLGGLKDQLLASGKDLIAPGLLMGASAYMTHRGERKEEKERKKEKEEELKEKKELQKYLNQHLDVPLYSHPMVDQDYYRLPSRHYKKGGRVLERRYKNGGAVMAIKGTLLKGRGKGQDDLINKTIPEYTWIHDAHTVSALGDGTTEAGHKEIRKFEEKIKREKLPHVKEKIIETIKENKPRQVKCAVANGEHSTPLMLVGALGDGSFEKGAQIMRDITKEIRLHKVSKKDKLPPAAHDLETYYKKVLQKKGY